MPLSAAQKARVRMYLGYSQAVGGGDPLERVFPGLSAETQELAVEVLASLTALETRISSAGSQAHLSRVEDVYFAEDAGLRGLRTEGRRLCQRLASLLGVPVANDVFGTGSTNGPTLRG